VLAGLEDERPTQIGMPEKTRVAAGAPAQLDLFLHPKPSEVERILREIDLDRVTPLDALALLSRLRDLSKTP
jgi:hypothetical protein